MRCFVVPAECQGLCKLGLVPFIVLVLEPALMLVLNSASASSSRSVSVLYCQCKCQSQCRFFVLVMRCAVLLFSTSSRTAAANESMLINKATYRMSYGRYIYVKRQQILVKNMEGSAVAALFNNDIVSIFHFIKLTALYIQTIVFHRVTQIVAAWQPGCEKMERE